MRILNRIGSVRRPLVWVPAGLACIALLLGVLLLRRTGTTGVQPLRFVDPQLRLKGHAPARDKSGVAELSTVTFPVGSLLSETRYVLTPFRQEVLVFARDVTVPADGHVQFFPEVPDKLLNVERIALRPRINVDRNWQRLPAEIVKTEDGQGKRRVHVRLALPAAAAGKQIEVYVEGIAIAPERTTSYRTQPVQLPTAARLSFGMGIKRPAWSQGPVVFTIKACDEEADVCEPVFSERLDPSSENAHGWQDRAVSLESLAGRTRAFLFETRVSNPNKDAFSLPAWSNPTVYVPRVPTDGPNVILLSIDTLSAKHLPLYGYTRDTAPFIDATFAKQGTVFDHCVAAAVTTPPSHMTMFTSVQPSVHGLTVGLLQTLPDWLVTLAETLRAGGFETGAVTEDGWLGTEFGFGRGFNSYAENKSPDVMSPLGQVKLTFQKARTWLAHNKDRRFFLFLHTFQVHDPYMPPPEYLGFFDDHGQPITDASPQAVREQVAYDREIRYTDDELRSLFETLEQDGLSQNTIFILVSDHGEEFFEHGYWGHGAHLYEETTHVPLMFWGPGHIPAGKRVAAPVGHIDLMPTILEIAGVSNPSQVMGTSFADLLFDKPRSDHTERPHFAEAWGGLAVLPDYTSVEFERPAFMMQIGTRKLSRYRKDGGFVYEYYDLATDPEERTNRYADGPPGVTDMRARIDEYEHTARARAMNLEDASKHAPEEGRTPVLDPATEEKLRALGYLK